MGGNNNNVDVVSINVGGIGKSGGGGDGGNGGVSCGGSVVSSWVVLKMHVS